jgi:hypothetical protein
MQIKGAYPARENSCGRLDSLEPWACSLPYRELSVLCCKNLQVGNVKYVSSENKIHPLMLKRHILCFMAVHTFC